MDIRKFGAAMTAYVLLVGVFAVADNLTYAFLITASTSLLLLLLGAVLLPRFQTHFSIPIPSSESADAKIYFVKLAGADIPLRPYVQVASCTLSLRHIPELASCALLAVAVLVMIVSGSASYHLLVTGWGLFALEVACMAGAAVLLVCLGWADECRFLRGAHMTLAPISGSHSGLGLQRLTYEFLDSKRNRFGGYTRSFLGQSANAVVVFYKPNNPDHNRAHLSLHFHQIRINSVAALRLPEKAGNERVPS